MVKTRKRKEHQFVPERQKQQRAGAIRNTSDFIVYKVWSAPCFPRIVFSMNVLTISSLV